MTTLIGTLQKIEYITDKVYYVQGRDGGLFYLTNEFGKTPYLDSYLYKEDIEWSVLDWNYLADTICERYRVNGILTEVK